MNKKKAKVCTVLFAIILYSIIIASMFIGVEFENGQIYPLFRAISAFVTGSWSVKKIEQFYHWLNKEN